MKLVKNLCFVIAPNFRIFCWGWKAIQKDIEKTKPKMMLNTLDILLSLKLTGVGGGRHISQSLYA